MVNERSPLDHELLVAQIGWVRSLARNLVRDPSVAEDLEQEAYLAALKMPPPDAADATRLRAWLSRVVQNLSRLTSRGNARRFAREVDAAKRESTGSALETVERAAVLRLLVDAVMDLDEPSRSSVLLRYFEGLSTAEIADQTGASQVAVRKRISRGLKLLRKRLDNEFGDDRQAWFAALAPLTGWYPIGSAPFPAPTPPTPITPGALTGSSSLSLGPLLVVCALLGGLGLWRVVAAESDPLRSTETVARLAPGTWEARLAPVATGRVAIPERGGAAVHDSRLRTGGGRPEVRKGEPVPQPAEESPVDAVGHAVHGQVLDLSGAPLAGLDVAADADPDRALARTGANGEFDLLLTRDEAVLRVTAAGFATVRESRVTASNRDADHVIVVGRAVSVAGRVVDAAGLPLPGALVEKVWEESVFLDVPVPLHLTTPVTDPVLADGAGRFALTGIVAAKGAFLRASLDGYVETRVPMPGAPMNALVMTLRRPSEPERWLTGVVRHHDGRPAVDADIRLGDHRARTDQRGEFTLHFDLVDPDAVLVIEKDGFLPTFITDFGSQAEDEAGSSGFQAYLGGPALAIGGQLLDPYGDPAAGWFVYATDDEEGEGYAGDELDVHSGRKRCTITDAHGLFWIDGLEEGDYRIHAYDPVSLVMMHSDPHAAGERGALLRVPVDALAEALRGRLVDADGIALGKALVTLSLPAGMPGAQWRELGPSTTTDADGSFRLDAVPGQHVEIVVQHSGVQQFWAVESEEDDGEGEGEGEGDDEVEIRLTGARHFRLAGWDERVDAVVALDGEGNLLPLHGSEPAARRASVHEGRSSVLTVSGGARRLVLLRGDVEVARMEVDLARDGVTVFGP